MTSAPLDQRTVAIVTLPGFNEIDSFVATRMIDSVDGLGVELVGPEATAVSMAGVEVATPGELQDLAQYPAVIVGSGFRTFEHIENKALMSAFALGQSELGQSELGQPNQGSSDQQLLGSQCSGAAILHRLGLVDGIAVCTDLFTTPKLEAIGVEVANEAFRVNGNLATSGGCLSSAYLAFWMISRLTTLEAAVRALEWVAPVGEVAAYVERAVGLTQPSMTPT